MVRWLLPMMLALTVPTGAVASDPLEDAIVARKWTEVERFARQRIEESARRGSAQEVELLTSLGIALNEQGRFAEAETVYRRALALAGKVRPVNVEMILNAEENVALERQNQAHYAEAERSYRAILARRRASNAADGVVATTLNRLAGAIAVQGRYAEADPLLREALALRLKAYGDKDPFVAQTFNTLAVNLENQGKYAEAEPVYRRALEIRQAALGENNASVATSLSNLALNLQTQGGDARLTEAGEYHVRALQVSRKVWGDESPYTATAFNNVANYLEQFGQYAQAEQFYRFALDIRQKTLAPDHPFTLTTLNNLAYNFSQQGKVAQAAALYREVLKVRRAQLGPRHPDVVVSLNNLSFLLAGQAATRDEALGLAREAAVLARGLSARTRAGETAGKAAASQAVSRAIAGDASGPSRWRFAYELMLDVAWRRAQDVPADSAKLRDEAFVAAQDLDQSAAGRAMALTAARLAVGRGPLADLVQRQQTLARQAADLDAGIVRGIATLSAPELARLRDQSGAVGVELAQVDGDLQTRFPRYRDLISPAALDIAAVQHRLEKDEGLLLIVPAGSHLYSFAISHDGAAWTRWDGGVVQVKALVDTLRCQVDPVTCAPGAATPDLSGADTLPFDRDAAYRIYQRLIAPVESVMRGKTRLFATMSGPLADLPLQILLTAPFGDGDDLAKAPWLGDRYALATLPAVAILRSRRERRPGGASLPFIGFGAPSLDGDSNAAEVSRSVAGLTASDGSVRASPETLRKLSPLPGTRIELVAMAQVLAAAPGTVRLGPRATEAALRSEPDIARTRVIAFATHGLLPREIDGMAEPALVLTPPRVATAEDDGLLTASEAATLSLRADWVILSACNTASNQGGGDSLSSLARGFLYAGAGALLASHWRIGDEVTAALTVETLRQARADPAAGHAVALMRAERVVRSGRRDDGTPLPGWMPDWAHPMAWGPFSLIGSGD